MWKIFIPIPIAILFVLAIPLFSYSPGFAVVKSCYLTKVGPNAPKDAVYPPGCQTGGAQGVVELAKAHLTTGRYSWGAPPGRDNWAAMDPNAGKAPTTFDCSGFSYWSWYWGTNGKVKLPGNTSAVWNGTGPWQKFKTTNVHDPGMQPGDLVYFGEPVHHVGIFEGAGGCGDTNCFLEYYTSGLPGRENTLSKEPDFVGYVRPNL